METSQQGETTKSSIQFQNPFTKEEAGRLFRDGSVPGQRLERIYDYTWGNPTLLRHYVKTYNRREDTFARLKAWAVSSFEKDFSFDSPAHLNLLAACSMLTRISFSLFANLTCHYKLSAYERGTTLLKSGLFREENGFYFIAPYFRDFLAKKVEQYFSGESMEKIRSLLVGYLIQEKNFQTDYLKLAGTPVEKKAMENRLAGCILERGADYYDNDLLKMDIDEVEHPGLRLLMMLERNFPFNEVSIRCILKDLEQDPFHKLLMPRYAIFMGRNLCPGKEPMEPCLEAAYLEAIRSWLDGTRTEGAIDGEFFRCYGFFNVPDYLLYRIDETKLLKEAEYRKWTFQGRLTVLYNYYLKGEYVRAQKLFYHLLRTYKRFFLQEYREAYYFILGLHFYSRKRYQKAKWYLEDALNAMENKGEKIFVLKMLNALLRILYEEKDVKGLGKLLERSKLMLTREKPFVAFLQYLKGCIKLLEGDDPVEDLQGSIQYSIEIGDEVSAVQYYSYTLSLSDQADGSLLKVQESLLDEDQLAIYQNTSIIDRYRRISLDFNFFGPLNARLPEADLTPELLARKKLRKILSYIVFHHPAKVSREEIKRVFWDSDKCFDVDANLRVAISNLKKIFKAHGYSDLIVCKDTRIYFNERYTVNNDFRKFSALFRKAKALYRSGDHALAEGYLRKLVQLNPESVFMDVPWDYLEKRVRQQTSAMLAVAHEILFELARNARDWKRAEEHCRKLAASNPRYRQELSDILVRNGKEEEAQALLQRKDKKKGKSLGSIFFPE